MSSDTWSSTPSQKCHISIPISRIGVERAVYPNQSKCMELITASFLALDGNDAILSPFPVPHLSHLDESHHASRLLPPTIAFCTSSFRTERQSLFFTCVHRTVCIVFSSLQPPCNSVRFCNSTPHSCSRCACPAHRCRFTRSNVSRVASSPTDLLCTPARMYELRRFLPHTQSGPRVYEYQCLCHADAVLTTAHCSWRHSCATPRGI